MKLKNFLIITMLIFLVGCSTIPQQEIPSSDPLPLNSISSAEESSSSAAESTEPTNLVIENVLEKMGATILLKMQYIDSHHVYITATNNDFSQENAPENSSEHIVAHIDTLTGDITVQYRGFHANSLNDSLNVSILKDRTHVIFTGKVLLYIKDNQVESIPIDEYYNREAALHIQTNQLAYVHPTTFELHINDLTDGKDFSVYQIPDEQSKMVHNPRFNQEGTSILFQQVGSSTVSYKKLILSDLTGNITKEIDMEIVSDAMYHFWTQNGFARMYQYEDTPATIFHYNLEGEMVGKIEFDAFIPANVYPINNQKNIMLLPSYDYVDEYSSLQLIDFNTHSSKELYKTEKIITDAALSPDGEQVIWLEMSPDTIYISETILH